MAFVFPPEAPVGIPVAGSDDLFAVRRVYCVGRNYAAHAREMGFDPDREPPFFFCKPADAVVPVAHGETLELAYPAQTQNYHYEAELVAVIGKGGRSFRAGRVVAYGQRRDEAEERCVPSDLVGGRNGRRSLQVLPPRGGR